jgi:hypothetical protein
MPKTSEELRKEYQELAQKEQDLLAALQTCEDIAAVSRFLDAAGTPPAPPPDPHVIGYRVPAGLAGRDAPDPCDRFRRPWENARDKARKAWDLYQDALEKDDTSDSWFNQPPSPVPESDTAQGFNDQLTRDRCRELFPTLSAEQLAAYRKQMADLASDPGIDAALKKRRLRNLEITDEEIARELKARGQ